MLYQLSYLGISGPQAGLGAPVYSQAGRACLPCFAFLSGVARRAKTDGYARRASLPLPGQIAGESGLILVLVRIFAAGNDIRARQPAVQVDVPAALGTERA
jgi:hypothetical protein